MKRALPYKAKVALLFLVTLLLFSFIEDAAGNEVRAEPQTPHDLLIKEIRDLKQRLRILEDHVNSSQQSQIEHVDLSENEASGHSLETPSHVLAKPWFENIDISGFAAIGYIATGKDGTRPHGGFLLKETTLFVEPR